MADRTVFFAKITRRDAFLTETFAAWLARAIDPTVTVTRYNRTWRFARQHIQEGFVVSRLGFVRITAGQQTRYDEVEQDFVVEEGEVSKGSFSHFVVDVQREIVAFEERPPEVRPQSFTSNFKALVEESGTRVSIELLADPATFPVWAGSVDRVTTVRAVVQNPNPGWSEDAADIRNLAEQAAAEEVDISAKAVDGESLNAGARWIRGAIEQVAEHGQGSVRATGRRGEDIVHWRSGQSRRTATMPEAIAGLGEAAWAWLAQRLRDIYGG